jgi:hypothetical protein
MIKELPAIISEEDLQFAVSEIYEKLKTNHPHLLAVKPIPAVSMLATAQEDYDGKHYLGDIIQFLSCGELLQQIKGEIA